MSGLSSAQREVQERVLTQYLPDWCNAQTPAADRSTFTPDWSFLTDGVARWFLVACDGIVQVRQGWPSLPDARRTYLFEKGRGIVSPYREGFLEVAAAGMLSARFNWPPERLSFQSPKVRGGTRLWAFDLLAYDGAGATRGNAVAVAGEVKWRQRDAVKLVDALRACAARGAHTEERCDQRRDNHRKYQGLLETQPRILWIIGPDAFLAVPDIVLRIEQKLGGILRIEPADASALHALAEH